MYGMNLYASKHKMVTGDMAATNHCYVSQTCHCSSVKTLVAASLTERTERLQRGQSAQRSSQRSMQERWNMCPQLPSWRTASEEWTSLRQMEHSVSSLICIIPATPCGSSLI